MMLAALHDTETIIWARPHEEHDPLLESYNPRIRMLLLPDMPGDLVSRIEDFVVFFREGEYGMLDQPPVDASTLRLARNCCRAYQSFARYLHQLRRSGQGYLPGLSLGIPGSPDGELARQEEEMVDRMSRELDSQFGTRLWNAKSGPEIVGISLEITMALKRFQIHA